MNKKKEKDIDMSKYLEFVEQNKKEKDFIWDVMNYSVSEDTIQAFLNGEISKKKLKCAIEFMKVGFSEKEAIENITPYMENNLEIESFISINTFALPGINSLANYIRKAKDCGIKVPNKIESVIDIAILQYKVNEYEQILEYKQKSDIQKVLEKMLFQNKKIKLNTQVSQAYPFGISYHYAIRNQDSDLINCNVFELNIANIVNGDTGWSCANIYGSYDQIEDLSEKLNVVSSIQWDNDMRCYILSTGQENLLKNTMKAADEIVLKKLLKLQENGKSIKKIEGELGFLVIDLEEREDCKRINEIIYENRELFDPNWVLKNIEKINLGIQECEFPNYNKICFEKDASKKSMFQLEKWKSLNYHKKNEQYFKQKIKENNNLDTLIENMTKKDKKNKNNIKNKEKNER